jgi:hypothetical protein
MDKLLAAELDHRASLGQHPVSLASIESTLRGLGYRLDRRLDCRNLARWMSGPRAGASYPALNTGIVEIDTGLSFANVEARRDAAFKLLQALRRTGECFAVVGGHILEI